MNENQPMDFTDNALESFYGAVDDPYFRDRDLTLIYQALKERLRLVPFGDYLKRYIYDRAGLEGDYAQIPLAEYQAIILDSFTDRHTPLSFEPTSARPSLIAKRWLTQQSVKRSAVLLLGFGLGMSAADVNELLTKALREQVLSPKDPLETLCWYCYRNHLDYPRFEALWRAFRQLPEAEDGLPDDILSQQTSGVRRSVMRISGEEELMDYLRRLRRPYDGARRSVAARQAFEGLYARARAVAAGLINEGNEGDRAARGDRGGLAARVRPEDVSPADIERIICSAIPMTPQGNLLPARASQLNAQFSGKRFSRQHIADVLAGKAGVDRFDLITLNFFIYAGEPDAHSHIRRRYSSFIESTNALLEQCGMGALYIANPYEAFVLMCLLAEDPLGTYADVLELSYQGASQE